jgi:hypothetical protein
LTLIKEQLPGENVKGAAKKGVLLPRYQKYKFSLHGGILFRKVGFETLKKLQHFQTAHSKLPIRTLTLINLNISLTYDK